MTNRGALGEVKPRDEMRRSRKIERRSVQVQNNVQVSRERICRIGSLEEPSKRFRHRVEIKTEEKF